MSEKFQDKSKGKLREHLGGPLKNSLKTSQTAKPINKSALSRDIKQFNELAKARKGEFPTNGHIVPNVRHSCKTPTGKKSDLTFPGPDP